MKYFKWVLVILVLGGVGFGMYYYIDLRGNPNYPSQCPHSLLYVKDILQPYLKYQLSFSNEELPVVDHLTVAVKALSDTECSYGILEVNNKYQEKTQYNFQLKKVGMKKWVVTSQEAIILSEPKSELMDLRF